MDTPEHDQKAVSMQAGQILEIPTVPEFRLPANVSLEARFGSHVTALDLGTPEELEADLKAFDLFAPEAPGWDSSSLASYNKVAQGNPSTYRRLKVEDTPGQRGDYAKAMMYGLFMHGRNVRVIFLDVPESLLSRQVADVVARQIILQNKWLPFDQAVDGLYDLLVKQAVINIRREHVMLISLAPVTERAIARWPRLQGRTARLLMRMGVYHQGMGAEIVHRQRLLRVRGFSYSEVVQPGCVRSSMKEFMDVCRTGVVPARELAARVYAQNLVSGRDPYSDREHNGIRAARVQAVVDSMSMDDIRAMYNESRLRR